MRVVIAEDSVLLREGIVRLLTDAGCDVVARVGDGYVLWFAATSGRRGDGRAKCLGAAVAPAPDAPFVPLPAPLHCTPGYWSIDPSPVASEAGLVLLWRQDDARHLTGAIVAAPLRADGLALAGPPTRLLTGEHPWEEGHPHGTPAEISPPGNTHRPPSLPEGHG